MTIRNQTGVIVEHLSPNQINNLRLSWRAEAPYIICKLCGEPIVDPDHVTVEHYYPRQHFPELSDVKSNLFPAHIACNNAKDNLMPLQWEMAMQVLKTVEEIVKFMAKFPKTGRHGKEYINFEKKLKSKHHHLSKQEAALVKSLRKTLTDDIFEKAKSQSPKTDKNGWLIEDMNIDYALYIAARKRAKKEADVRGSKNPEIIAAVEEHTDLQMKNIVVGDTMAQKTTLEKILEPEFGRKHTKRAKFARAPHAVKINGEIIWGLEQQQNPGR
jgi:hypothetical protein